MSCEREADKSRMRKNRAERPEQFRAPSSSRKTSAARLRARHKVRYAVRTGKLTKPKHCEDCGVAHSQLHGHHENYRKPLQVDWLCPDCHAVRHRKLKG